MAWVVDSCIALDVALGDPIYGTGSANLLEKKLRDGLIISPITYIELAPQFNGNLALLNEFCRLTGFDANEAWNKDDTLLAAQAFNRYIQLKQSKSVAKRPVADILIGAFACRFQGLITRNAADFKKYLPKLRILTPKLETR